MRATILKAALGAAFAISMGLPAIGSSVGADPLLSTGSLPGGGQYVVRRAPAVPVAAIALWYRAPGSGFEADPTPGIGRLAATAIAASTPITGRPLSRIVDEAGGRIVVSGYPNSIAVSVLVPADRASEVVRAMTGAFFTPVVDADGLKLAERDLDGEALIREFNPEDAIGDALLAQLFAAGAAHEPGLGAPGALRAISLDRVKAFAERAFRPANAVLVVTGAVDASVVGAAVPGRASAAPGTEPLLDAHPAPAASPQIKSGTEPGAGLGWVGPTIADERAATALDFVADYLFRSDTGLVQKPFAGTETSLTGKFVTYHDPGVFLVTISGGDVAAARTAVEAALAKLQTPLDPATFASATALFRYHMLSDIQTPGELADTLGWYAVEGDPLYAPGADGIAGRYFSALDALTPAFVAETVRKYLAAPGAVVAISTKKAEK
jgi:zinc protease